MKGRVFVGTSGWNYNHWKKIFYPDKMRPDDYLRFYAQSFDTVELNKSFYRLIDDASYKKWRDATPAHFIFAVKGSRYLTHMRKLTETKLGLDRFFKPTKKLGKKRGPVLFQLPPHWQKNAERLDAFIAALPRHIPVVFEFRDPTWFSGDVYGVLRRHRTAFCIYNFQERTSSPLETTADLVYLRFHGPEEYGRRRLRNDWLPLIRDQQQKGREVYCYFNNDARGNAIRDALALKELVA